MQPPQRDLSQQAGNPTSALQSAYQQLMSIQDPRELMQAAVDVVQPLVGKGMSEINYRKFMQNLQGSAKRGLQSIQMFLSNYILRGSGLGVAGVAESIQSIASMITEDVNESVELTPYQKSLKTMVENAGFSVVVIEHYEPSEADLDYAYGVHGGSKVGGDIPRNIVGLPDPETGMSPDGERAPCAACGNPSVGFDMGVREWVCAEHYGVL